MSVVRYHNTPAKSRLLDTQPRDHLPDHSLSMQMLPPSGEVLPTLSPTRGPQVALWLTEGATRLLPFSAYPAEPRRR